MDFEKTDEKAGADLFGENMEDRETVVLRKQEDKSEAKRTDINFFSQGKFLEFDPLVYKSATEQKIDEMLAGDTADFLKKRLFRTSV